MQRDADHALWILSVLNARREGSKYVRWMVRAFGIGVLVYVTLWGGVLVVAALQNILIFRPTVSSATIGVITSTLFFAVSLRQIFQRRTPPFLVNRSETAVFGTAPVSIWQLVRPGVVVQMITFFIFSGMLFAFLFVFNQPMTLHIFVQWLGICTGVACLMLHRNASHFALLEHRPGVVWTLILPLISASLVVVAFLSPVQAVFVTLAVYASGVSWLSWFVWKRLHSFLFPNRFVYKLNLKAEIDSNQFFTMLSNTAPSKTMGSLHRALIDAPIPNYSRDYSRIIKPLERYNIFAVKALVIFARSGVREVMYSVLNIAFFVSMIVLESPLFDPIRHVFLILALSYFLKRMYQNVSLPRYFPVDAHHAFVFDAQPKIVFVLAVYLVIGLSIAALGWHVKFTQFALALVIHLSTFLLLLRAKTSATLDENASETHLIVANIAALPLMFAKIFNLFEFALVFYAALWVLSAFNLIGLGRQVLFVASRFIRP